MSDIINYSLEAGAIKGTLNTETGEFILKYSPIRDNSGNIISTGSTPDWEAGQAPWYEFRELIKQIKLIDLKYLGSFAFYNCTNVVKTIFSESLIEIGVNAFELNSKPDLNETCVEYDGTIQNWCNINFNNSLANPLMTLGNLYLAADNGKVLEQLEITANINDFAFNGSTISSLIISSTSIGSYAFSNCSRLKYVALAPQVSTVGDYAFNECPSATIYVAASSPKAISGWSDSWNAGNNSVVWGAKNKGIYDEITDSLLFWEQSFDDKISIIKYLYTGPSKSVAIKLPAQINGYSISSIGTNAFSDAPITVFDAGEATAISVIKEGAFNKCTKLTTCNLPDSIESIGNFAFKQCFRLTTINLGPNVQDLGIGVFNQCYSLGRFEEGKPDGCACSVDNEHFYICDIPVSLSSKAKVSAVCKKSVSTGTLHIVHCLPYTLLTAMRSLAVEEPQNNKELAILFTDFVEVVLEDYSFSGCLNTKQADYKLDLIFATHETDAPVIGVSKLNIGISAFESAPIRNITLTGKEHTFNNNAFKDCYKLGTITYYGTLSEWCNMKFTNKYSNPLYYDVTDEGQYTKHFVPHNVTNPAEEWGEIQDDGKITLTDITCIPDCTFINQNNIQILDINNSDSDCYLTIGEAAFKNTNLRAIKHTKADTLKAQYIARSAFEHCPIEKLVLEASAKNPLVILDYAFCGGKSCQNFSLSEYTSYIGHYAFDQFLTLPIDSTLPEYQEQQYQTKLKVCTRYLKNFDTKYVTHLELMEDDTSLPQNIDWPNLTSLSLDFMSAANVNMLMYITPSAFEKCKKFSYITVQNNSKCKYFTVSDSNCLYQHLTDQIIELICATNNSIPSQIEASYPNSIIKIRDGVFKYRYFKESYPEIPKNTISISSTIFSNTTIIPKEE